MGHHIGPSNVRRACGACGARTALENLAYAVYVSATGRRFDGGLRCPHCVDQLSPLVVDQDESLVLYLHAA